jgi:hypothetical protein
LRPDIANQPKRREANQHPKFLLRF